MKNLYEKYNIKSGTLVVETVDNISKEKYCEVLNYVTEKCIEINKISIAYNKNKIEMEVIISNKILDFKEKNIKRIYWKF